MEEYADFDGPTEIVRALYEIVNGLFGGEKDTGGQNERPAPRHGSHAAQPKSKPETAPPDGGAVLIPELQAALEAMVAKSKVATCPDQP